MIKKTFFTLFIILININIARALNVSPIEVFIDTNDENLTASIKLENKTKNKIPVELVQYRRIHVNGIEEKASTDDFIIYPPQTILEPGSVQTVRLIWQGLDKKSKNIKSEIAYRLLVKQIPLKLKNEPLKKKHQSSLNIIYEYLASVYVQPKKPNSELKIDLKSYNPTNHNMLTTLKNTGNVHSILSFYDFFAKVDDLPTLIKLNPTSEISATNLLAGESRDLNFSGAKELAKKKFKIIYKQKNQRKNN